MNRTEGRDQATKAVEARESAQESAARSAHEPLVAEVTTLGMAELGTTELGMTELALLGRRRRGFTLVELLVVIVVIGILASLVVVAAMKAIPAARRASIGFEIAQLSQALERYKQEMGSYPPDFSGTQVQDLQSVQSHVSGRFRNRVSQTNAKYFDIDGHVDDAGNVAEYQGVKVRGKNFLGLDPSEALVFWLMGFDSNPLSPISGLGARQAFYDFDKSRLADTDNDGYAEYYPPRLEVPYVYYNANTYTRAMQAGAWGVMYPSDEDPPKKPSNPKAQMVLPYVQATPEAAQLEATKLLQKHYIEPQKYQIIAAGLDNQLSEAPYDEARFYPTGEGYTGREYDNQTSFSEGRMLEDMIP